MATQSKSIHSALKQRIRSQGKTYADAAEILNLSEPSIRRLFSTSALSLNRLETLCTWLGSDINEIVQDSLKQQTLITELTPQQEEELVKDHRLLLATYLVLNHWKEREILDTFNFTNTELTKYFIKLEKIGLIELYPYNRIRLLTARNFTWSLNGPVQKFFTEIILKEFLNTNFKKPGEKTHFVGGMLSKNSIIKLHGRIDELVRAFDNLVSEDLRLPVDDRFAVSLFLGFRPWEFSEFTKLRHDQKFNPFEKF